MRDDGRGKPRNRLLVIGDAMIDLYKICTADRVSPEAPVLVLNYRDQFLRLGGAANVAAGIVAMGTPCDLFTLVGADAQKDTLCAMLGDAGVEPRTLAIKGYPTILKERILSRNQQVCRIDYEDRFRPEDSAALMRNAVARLAEYDYVVVSDYDKGATERLPIFLAEAERCGVCALIDPKIPNWSRYEGAFLVKPNWSEFLAVLRSEGLLNYGEQPAPTRTEWIRSSALTLMGRHRISHLLVTMGAEGYLLVSEDGEIHAGSTLAREVFDLSGAGDSFLATLAAFLAQGASLIEAVKMGNIAAGIAVGHAGTVVVTLDELRRATGAELEEQGVLDELRRQACLGRKIVFTNGCFDILHTGHLMGLQRAKSEGDILVVGVNSDESVRRLKGEGRPITPLADRMEMLQGLKPVDFVLPFDEDTPENLILKIAPDVLVKGGDYSRETIVGADFVEGRGGRVVIVPIREGRSTTNIINRSKGRIPT